MIQVSDEVEKHLCCEEGRKTKEDIYRAESKCRQLRSELEAKLPTCAEKLMRLYTDWWYAVSDDGFPLQRPSDKYRRNDARIAKISAVLTPVLSHIESPLRLCGEPN